MEYWIWLRQLKGIGTVMEKRLLQHFKSPKAIYEAQEDELRAVEGIGEGLGKSIRDARSLDRASWVLEKVNKHDIKLLTYNDPLYPNHAKEFAEAPTLLYYKGSIRKDSIGVAIVGSRRCTSYGKQIAIEAASYLARNKVPVISGMAKGIDGYSHTACLKAGGYTIAFLGSSVDICYPKEHRELMEGIIENGAVISEYPPSTRPRPEYFPKRNALISSWSKKVLVVEAAAKSGALLTADLAKIQGKEVLVPPHEIYSPTGKGTNRLIVEGALMYLHPSQLLLGYDSFATEDKTHSKTVKAQPSNTGEKDNIARVKFTRRLTNIESKIVASLTDSIKTIEEIGKGTGIDEIQLIEHLSIMELEGMIQALPGGRFKLSVPS